MKKADVKNNLKKVENALEAIKKEDKIFTYATVGKYLPGCGEIKDVEEISELIKFQKEINKLTKNSDTEVINQLGLKPEEIPGEETTVLGISAKHWNKDIQTKLEEIRQNILIEKLEKAKATLKKHLSDDDKFEDETDGIEDLLKNVA